MRMSSGGIGSPVRMSRFDWRWNWVPAAGLELPVVSSGPKFSLNATCFSSSIGWSRNSQDRMLLESGADRPELARDSGRVMSMPLTSAPNSGCSLRLVMGPVLRIAASVDDRLIGEHAQLAADRVGRGRHELGQQNHRHVSCGSHQKAVGRRRPAYSPGVPRMCALAGSIITEAQAEADAVIGRFGEARHAHVGHVALQVVRGHELDRLAAEQAHAVELALVQHQLAETQIVGRRRHRPPPPN